MSSKEFAADSVTIERCMYSHCSTGWHAKVLAIVTIASGKPPHFFKISDVTSVNRGGQVSFVPKVLLKNNFLESTSLSGFI
jgi:hypothetical protein